MGWVELRCARTLLPHWLEKNTRLTVLEIERKLRLRSEVGGCSSERVLYNYGPTFWRECSSSVRRPRECTYLPHEVFFITEGRGSFTVSSIQRDERAMLKFHSVQCSVTDTVKHIAVVHWPIAKFGNIFQFWSRSVLIWAPFSFSYLCLI